MIEHINCIDVADGWLAFIAGVIFAMFVGVGACVSYYNLCAWMNENKDLTKPRS